MGRMHKEMQAKRLRLIRLAIAKRVSASKIGIVFIYVVFRVPMLYIGLDPKQSAQYPVAKIRANCQVNLFLFHRRNEQ
jgi:hypothetical protein